MGRCYYGQISGKFWVGIQSSVDADNFGIEPSDIINFKVCHCSCETSSVEKTFCNGCYSSYEEHVEFMKDDEELEDTEIDYVDTWYTSETEIFYNFEEKHVEFIEKQIQDLENTVGAYMDSYGIEDDDSEITYHYELPQNVPDETEKLCDIARLCLGKQILYCLKKYGSCGFCAEL
jgi:hypothetical protein